MIRLSIALLVVTCVGTGCASGVARRLYVLGTPLESTETEANGPVVWLRRVSLPDYLDSTDIVWRAGQHGLQTSPTGRWGERLSLGITQALATEGPVLVDVRVTREENTYPMIPAGQAARDMVG